MHAIPFAPGANVLIRDAEWRVIKVRPTPSQGQVALHCLGLSEEVRDQEAIFLTEYEERFGEGVQILDPAATQLVTDSSDRHLAGLLYLESQLRQKAPTDGHLYIGHTGAFDLLPYQLAPAHEAFKQVRQRILIADAVGLGKTLEAGILIAELMRRGRGRRILVLTVKSMLTQFQKELWCRFAIPLVRLDSVGLQRIRATIPTNHNPFYHHDKTIISIDTLKQNNEYRVYLEQAWWDIIVVDEAHNVATRGGRASLRAELAKLLSSRSDTLILLSATPHDGRARSFASLMNMLDPTAIADPEHYAVADIRGLYVRRFKKDIAGQAGTAFQQRHIRTEEAPASEAEEAAYEALQALNFTAFDQRRGGGLLFKTTLMKALFSSPQACLQTVAHRITKTRRRPDAARFAQDLQGLEALRDRLQQIGPEAFSRYQSLCRVIQSKDHFGWDGTDPSDRLVIFTERLETLNFLKANLPAALGLKEEAVAILKGSEMSDRDQQAVVEAFGQEGAPVRLLIATDVASEGINLHYLCHRLIHVDMPWSLMVFQQRNGRIDRYGQRRSPEIVYLTTRAKQPKIKGDLRILEVLKEKDEQAAQNIGDPSCFMGLYDADAETVVTGRAIEAGLSSDGFSAALTPEGLAPNAFQGLEMDLEAVFGGLFDTLEDGEDQEDGDPEGDHAAPAHPQTSPPAPAPGTEPARTEPARTEPARTEPARTEQARTEQARTEPARTEPARTEPARTEQAGIGPARACVPRGLERQLQAQPQPDGSEAMAARRTPPSLFASEMAFLEAGLQLLRTAGPLEAEVRWEDQTVALLPPPDLARRLRTLPIEVREKIKQAAGVLHLTPRTDLMQAEVAAARTQESAWPLSQFLWGLHPVMAWLEDRLANTFGRHQAPVMGVGRLLDPEEAIVLTSALIPNQKGHPLLHHWYGVHFQRWHLAGVLDTDGLTPHLESLGRGLVNREGPLPLERLQTLVPTAVAESRREMSRAFQTYSSRLATRLEEEERRLKALEARRLSHELERFARRDLSNPTVRRQKEEAEASVRELFQTWSAWVRDTLTARDAPFIQVLAVLVGEDLG